MLSANAKGAFMMSIARVAFVTNDALMKILFADMEVFQAMFLRGSIALPIIAFLAWYRKCLLVRFTIIDFVLLCVRAAAQIGMATCFLTALSHMPIANVSAIMQAVPLSLIVFAALFLGESVGWRRWSAVVIGFCGVLLIIRPGTDGFDIHTTLAVGAVAFATINDLVTRYLPNRVPALLAALFSATAVSMFSGAMILDLPWQAVTPFNWLILSFCGLTIAAGYFFQVMTMRYGDLSFVAPYRYVGMVWAIILGLLIFGEWPDTFTAIGTLIVVLTGLYAVYREQLRRVDI
ncbi:DMT family transporter [Candidatus Puniceispirillum sp.]|nr:DMT family transporter [Candidatus Puniceispirillum sp.]